jgi:hypothetical protein
MGEGPITNQNQGDKSDKISQLEKEIEVIKNQAKDEYQEKRTKSPVRERIIKSLTSIEIGRQTMASGVTLNTQSNANPTYIKESTLATSTRLNQSTVHDVFKQNISLQGKKGALKVMLKIGIAFFIISLLFAFYYLIIHLS